MYGKYLVKLVIHDAGLVNFTVTTLFVYSDYSSTFLGFFSIVLAGYPPTGNSYTVSLLANLPVTQSLDYFCAETGREVFCSPFQECKIAQVIPATQNNRFSVGNIRGLIGIYAKLPAGTLYNSILWNAGALTLEPQAYFSTINFTDITDPSQFQVEITGISVGDMYIVQSVHQNTNAALNLSSTKDFLGKFTILNVQPLILEWDILFLCASIWDSVNFNCHSFPTICEENPCGENEVCTEVSENERNCSCISGFQVSVLTGHCAPMPLFGICTPCTPHTWFGTTCGCGDISTMCKEVVLVNRNSSRRCVCARVTL